jgi:hypothetical protein
MLIFFVWLTMPKKDTDQRQKRGRGRPAKGKKKMTFKLEPEVATALEKARDLTGRGKSQLVEEAVRAYLHLTENPK